MPTYYKRPKGCSKGEDCSFWHDDNNIPGEQRALDYIQDQRLEKSGLFGKGRGKGKGKGVCWAFQNGRCKYGAFCGFEHGQFDMVNNFIKVNERVDVGVLLGDVDNEPTTPGPDGTEPETHEATSYRPVKGEVSSPLSGGDRGTFDKGERDEYHSDLKEAGNQGNLDKNKDRGYHNDERVEGLVSFLRSGHTLISSKEGIVVNRKPPAIRTRKKDREEGQGRRTRKKDKEGGQGRRTRKIQGRRTRKKDKE